MIGEPSQWPGVRIIVSKLVPDDGHTLLAVDVGAILGRSRPGLSPPVLTVGPLTFWRIQHPGRDPFLSNYNPGSRELARDRRRR